MNGQDIAQWVAIAGGLLALLGAVIAAFRWYGDQREWKKWVEMKFAAQDKDNERRDRDNERRDDEDEERYRLICGVVNRHSQ